MDTLGRLVTNDQDINILTRYIKPNASKEGGALTHYSEARSLGMDASGRPAFILNYIKDLEKFKEFTENQPIQFYLKLDEETIKALKFLCNKKFAVNVELDSISINRLRGELLTSMGRMAFESKVFDNLPVHIEIGEGPAIVRFVKDFK